MARHKSGVDGESDGRAATAGPGGSQRLLDGVSTAREALSQATQLLADHEIPDTPLEARTLVRAALGVSQAELLTSPGSPVTPEQLDELGRFMERRLDREPLQYIIGEVEFYGRQFTVDERVLIPRPETELLVEQALLRTSECDIQTPSVLDIGTGSGVLAATLAKELASAKVVATDISQAALDVAAENAHRQGVSGQIELRRCSLAEGVSGPFDIVVCNPPYVRSGFLDGPDVQPELANEPRLALDGGADGMDVYRPLFAALPALLSDTGAAYIEIDPPVAEGCVSLAKQHMPRASASVLTDLAGLERCMAIELAC